MRHGSFRCGVELLEDRAVPAAVGTANENFIDQIYRDLLHRAPDPGSASWVAQLDNGKDRDDIVRGILNSEEGRRTQVNDLYLRFLGRPADQGGLDYWTGFLRNNSNLDLATQLIASEEYYQTQAGGTDFGFLDAIYQDILGRSISFDEVVDRGDDFSDGAEDRRDIAEGVFESNEGEYVRAAIAAESFLRATNLPPEVIDDFADDDDGDAAYATSVLFGDAYYVVSQQLTPADFATIPATEPIPAPGTTTSTSTTTAFGSTTTSVSLTTP